MRRALAVVAGAVALAGCNADPENGGSGREGGSVVVGLAAAPDSMDPALASSPEAIQVLTLAHTPLLTYARREGAGGTRIVPGLAEKVPEPSEDGLTWELTLRKGLRYSNGRAVRACRLRAGAPPRA